MGLVKSMAMKHSNLFIWPTPELKSTYVWLESYGNFLSEYYCCHCTASTMKALSKDKLTLEGNNNIYIDMKTGDLYWEEYTILYFSIKHANISFLRFSKQQINILTQLFSNSLLYNLKAHSDFFPGFKEWQQKHLYLTFRMIKFWKITWHIQHDSTGYFCFIRQWIMLA